MRYGKLQRSFKGDTACDLAALGLAIPSAGENRSKAKRKTNCYLLPIFIFSVPLSLEYKGPLLLQYQRL